MILKLHLIALIPKTTTPINYISTRSTQQPTPNLHACVHTHTHSGMIMEGSRTDTG